MADIFVSYSRHDKLFVEKLYRELRRFKVRGFMDVTDLASGASLSRRLQEAIENADAVLVVLSRDASRSSWVMAEMGLAQSLNKLVIPVLAPHQNYEDSVPPHLVDRLVVDATNLPIEEVAARVVAAATNTSVESARDEVQSRYRRQKLQFLLVVFSLTLLSMISIYAFLVAQNQRRKAEIALRSADIARVRAEQLTREAENQEKRLKEIVGRSAAIAISPDGGTFAAGYGDGNVRLWNRGTSVVTAVFSGHTGAITGLSFSPDGHLLASAGWDGEIQLWDVRTRALLRRLKASTGAINSLTFSADGASLFSRPLGGDISEWNVRTGDLVKTLRLPE